jgi:integrase/recombinase XerC
MTRIDDFLKYLQAEKRYAPRTVKAYKTVLNQFHSFCREDGREDMDLHFRTIRSWVVSMMDAGTSPRTVHKKLTALRTYCKYLIQEGVMETNPLKPRINKRTPVFVDENSMSKLLDEYSFGEDFEGTRNRLIIELLYLTGMRRSELIGLRCGSLDRHGKTLRVLGKRNKERLIPLGDELLNAIGDYLEKRADVVVEPGTEELIVTSKGRPAYESMIYRVVRKYLSMVTTLDKKSPHVLRHSFATHMLNRGADLNAIKELLGHANLSATQVYTHNTFKKLKTIYNLAHPRA